MKNSLEEAVEVIKTGGIVIFPTDTAFGIGCRIDDENAVRRLFKMRRRPMNKAVPVLVSSIRMAEKCVDRIEPNVQSLMEKYWPGGLTLILQCMEIRMSNLVRGGEKTIGIRMPNHETTLELIRRVGVPIIGSSANFSGGKTPFKFSDLDPELVRLADFVLPGRCSVKKASTVVDTTKKPWRILREGAVKVDSRN